MSDNPHPFIRCAATSARTHDRCGNAAKTGEALCWQHLNERAKSAGDNTNVLEPLPDIDMSSTPDDVIARWLRSRDEKTRFFAAKTALARSLAPTAKAVDGTTAARLKKLSDADLRAEIAALRAHLVDRRDNPQPESRRPAPVAARDVMANLKTSRDARIAVNAALELETYDAQRPVEQKPSSADVDHDAMIARCDAIVDGMDRAVAESLAYRRSSDEIERRQLAARAAIDAEPVEPVAPPVVQEPNEEPVVLGRITRTRNSDGSITETIPQFYSNGDPNGELVREYPAPSRSFNPFSLLND